MKYLILFRGINVGGKNKVSMLELKQHLEVAGFRDVSSYINSGNVLLSSEEAQSVEIEKKITELLHQKFKLDSPLIKTLAITKDQLKAIVKQAPTGFGEEPDRYYSDVVFLIGKSSVELMNDIETNPEVDAVWQGEGVVYYRRLGAMRVKSRLSKIVMKPIYKNITIRSWGTVTKLLALMTS